MAVMIHDFWKPRSLEKDDTLLWRIGSLSLWTCKAPRGWYLYWRREETFAVSPMVTEGAELPEDAPWTAFLTGEEKQIQMRPRFPDRSMVVRPLQPEVLMPRRTVYLFVYTPLWLAVTAGHGKTAMVLTEIPTVESSKTWFGTSFAGELCYALEGGIHTVPDNASRGDFHAVVPLKITNNSPQNLAFQRLNLKTPHLKLFAAADFFCSNQVDVSFKGVNEESHIVFRSGPPEKWKPRHVAAPRQKQNRDMISKTFWFIRD